MKQSLWFLLFSFFVISCSNKYSQYSHQYKFRNLNGEPEYNQLDYWAAHPYKWDPSDSVPAPLRQEPIDTLVDVFFLHPTTFTEKEKNNIPNASIDDSLLNAKTDYSTILFQASVFNRQCRVFAPRYRQAHIYNFFKEDKVEAAKAFELAYVDLKTAFTYYLQNLNNGRPIIIAGHSQGAFLGQRLVKEFFDGTTLQNKLVVAYLIGWPLAENYYKNIPVCADSLKTSCACSWRTYRKGYLPEHVKSEKEKIIVTNPLNWTTTSTIASKKMNIGSVLTNFNKIYKHTTDAQVSNGVLHVSRPKFPWSFFYRTNNYHIADINLFYLNIQEDVKRRIGLYWKH